MENEELLAALVRRGRTLAAEISTLQEELSALTSRVSDLVPVGSRLEVDGVPVTHARGNRKFDQQVALTLLDPEERLACMKTGLDAAAVRKAVDAKGLLEDCMVLPEGAKTSIRLTG